MEPVVLQPAVEPLVFRAADLSPVLPELVLAIGALVLLMFGVFRGDRAMMTVNMGALALLFVAGVALWMAPEGRLLAFGGTFIVDGFARFLKTLVLIGSGAAILMAGDWLRAERFHRFEFGVLVLIATLGMMLMISANDLISLYLGLELQSLCVYVLASLQRDSVRSTEAGLKFFVLGSLSSGMFLYGASLVYGFTGTTGFPLIAAAVDAGEISLGLVFGLVFVLAGLAFKLSAVPFHMWTPDVYEGAPTPITAFLAGAPKVAAIAMIMRVLVGGFVDVTDQWQQIIVFLSIASMALGAFAAIGQSNIKRLMAYSSIGNMGYALIGLAAGTAGGIGSVLIYMAIYLAMTLGTFACILAMRRDDTPVETIEDLAGLARTNRTMAFLLAALMFSLAGIPPLAGFFAKFFVFLAAIEAGLVALAVIGVLASVVSAYYYLRIVKVMFFDEPIAAFDPMGGEIKLVLGLSGAFVLLFVFLPAPLIAAAEAAAVSLF